MAHKGLVEYNWKICQYYFVLVKELGEHIHAIHSCLARDLLCRLRRLDVCCYRYYRICSYSSKGLILKTIVIFYIVLSYQFPKDYWVIFQQICQ